MTTHVHKGIGAFLVVGLATLFGFAGQDLLNAGTITSDAPEIVHTAWAFMPFLLPFGAVVVVAVMLMRW